MLGLGRNGLRKLAGRRALSAVAQTSSTAASSPAQSVEFVKKQTKTGSRSGNLAGSTPVEQIRLQKKYQEKLESNKLGSLHEAVEYIEWRGTVYPNTVTKIIGLLQSSTDLASLSDRQLAVLLSAFGAACDTLSRSLRAAHLERVEKILTAKGVRLGLQTRNQLIEAKIDNRSRVDAVEELGKFEQDGIELDSKAYALLCEVYAKQANTKAITDIISHMKSAGMTLTEDHVAQLVYSVARGGGYAQVGRVVDTFATSMNVVRLRCAAARAIAEREKNEPGRGGYEITEMLRAIPTTAKLHSFENNVYVLNVLMDLFENGQFDAFTLLSAYLNVAESGTTLSDNYLNMRVVARAKSLLSEASVEEACALYSCIHPNYANDFFVQQLNRQLTDSLAAVTAESLPAFLKTLTLAENRGLITGANEFLLTAATKSDLPAFPAIFEHVQQAGDVRRCVGHNPSLKKPLARQLAHRLVKSTSSADQAALLAQIATVLFAPAPSELPEHQRSYSPIIYKMANKDVKLVVPALQLMPSSLWHEKRDFATAIVRELLYTANTDHLAVEKLRVLIESNTIDQLSAIRFHPMLTKFLLGDKAPLSERIQMTAKLLAYDFPPDATASSPVKFGPRNLAKFLSNEMISLEVATKIIAALENETRASMNSEELADARRVLATVSAPKAELLGNLKRSVTFQRWRATPVKDLLRELASFKDSTKSGVKNALKRVILKKTLSATTEDIDFLVTVLESSVEWRKEKDGDEQVLELCEKLESVTLLRALVANEMVLADRIWQMRSGQTLPADVLLTYVSRLFLNGELERADDVCEELRGSSQSIRPQTLEKMGRRLKGVDIKKMGELAKYLGKQFNLAEPVQRRVVVQAKTDQLIQLIESDDLTGALQMAVEETSESGRAFGQVPIMIAAIKRNDAKTLETVHQMVRNAHDTYHANVNLAYALIHSNHVSQARNLVSRQNLNVDDRVLQYFTTLASAAKEPRLLKDLFLVFNGRASTLELNKLLELATRKMWNNNDIESLRELSREIETTSFPLRANLRTFFDNLDKKYSTESQDFA